MLKIIQLQTDYSAKEIQLERLTTDNGDKENLLRSANADIAKLKLKLANVTDNCRQKDEELTSLKILLKQTRKELADSNKAKKIR